MGSSERNSQPEKAGGYVGTKIVTKRLKDGTIKRYRYYQLMRTYRQGGKGKTEYLDYLGKDPHRRRCNSQPGSRPGSSFESEPRHGVIANRGSGDEGELRDVAASQAPLPIDVIANRGRPPPSPLPPPLDLEVIEPEGGGLWSFPHYRARCRRCGEPFEMIKFEVELGHYLCPRCRAEIIREGECWPGYGTPRGCR